MSRGSILVTRIYRISKIIKTWILQSCPLRELLKTKREQLPRKQITRPTKLPSFKLSWKNEFSFVIQLRLLQGICSPPFFFRHILMKYAFLTSWICLSYYSFHFYFICFVFFFFLSSFHLDCPLLIQKKKHSSYMLLISR